jgi:RNA polymerase sigma-70 factor (ECF subfamily)
MRKDGEDMELALNTPAPLRAVPRAEPDTANDASDADLLVRVAERDRDAFELLYRRYVRSVFGLALRRLRDRQRAEDAVQETFASVWRSAHSYRPERGAPAPGL